MKRVRTIRDSLAGKHVRVLLIAAMAVPGSVLAASSPANAVDFVHVCEISGHGYCVGAPNLGVFQPVVETAGGRDLFINSAGGGVELQIAADPALCVAAGNGGVVVVLHPCNGGVGQVWHEQNGPAGKLFESNEFSGRYLSGANRNGSQYEIKSRGASGWNQQFTV